MKSPIKPSIDERCFNAKDQRLRLIGLALDFAMQSMTAKLSKLPRTADWCAARSRMISRMADLFQEVNP